MAEIEFSQYKIHLHNKNIMKKEFYLGGKEFP